ncbi:AroM family protein [Humitalea sp. 24SJ18S-53]|uniref:AroM family protein n=1 Tax=Humitalea sp. 24SJ18S-53 TaxID=3422307 RepID=UPI003D67546B
MRLGVVTTGHGPRIEYPAYHKGLAATLGVDLDVIDEHILEGLEWPEISQHLGGETEARLGAHVRVPGATGNRLGDGWAHVYVRLDWALAYFQAAIDRLVARGAHAVLLCCATDFAEDAFRCPVPLVKPASLMRAAVADRVHAAAGPLRFGLTSSVGHARQDVDLWRQQSFADRLEIDYASFEGDIMPAAEELSRKPHDLVVVWSYGLGMADRDPPGLAARLEAMLGCPVLMPHRVAALAALGVMPVGFDDRRFVLAGRG